MVIQLLLHKSSLREVFTNSNKTLRAIASLKIKIYTLKRAVKARKPKRKQKKKLKRKPKRKI